jgi:hypothetical protein
MNAVLIRSEERFESFRAKLAFYGIDCTVLDFAGQEWIDFDYSAVDFLIFYPSFEVSSNFPVALYKVQDNIIHIHHRYPDLLIYPDPNIVYYYNDKYRQFLFLKTRSFPLPDTVPLLSEESVECADRKLGYPMVVKNRYGAGGGAVFLIRTRKELEAYYKISQFDFIHMGALKYLYSFCMHRTYLYLLVKARKMRYPFLSPPLLAQKFLTIDHDLKTVVGDGRVVEGHWRFQATKDQWKVNIDGGGIGQWSRIPEEAVALSEKLAGSLSASWINIDLIPSHEGFLITEFSPVWHHYAYREKPTFVYKDDYNIQPPLETSLDLERIIVESLMRKRKAQEAVNY